MKSIFALIIAVAASTAFAADAPKAATPAPAATTAPAPAAKCDPAKDKNCKVEAKAAPAATPAAPAKK